MKDRKKHGMLAVWGGVVMVWFVSLGCPQSCDQIEKSPAFSKCLKDMMRLEGLEYLMWNVGVCKGFH